MRGNSCENISINVNTKHTRFDENVDNENSYLSDSNAIDNIDDSFNVDAEHEILVNNESNKTKITKKK